MTNRYAAIFCALLILAGCADAAGLADCTSVAGEVKDRASDGSSVKLAVSAAVPQECQKPGEIVSLAVTESGLKTRALATSRGDRITIYLKGEGGAANSTVTVTDFVWLSIAEWPPLPIVMVGILLAFLMVTFVVSKNIRGLLLIGKDNRYSNSKTQMILWFGVTIVVYLTAFFFRARAGYYDHISIPHNLLLLSGLSALTAGAAQAITSQKQATAARQGLRQKQPAASSSLPSDLIKADDNSFDLGDYQMIVITLVAVATYLVTAIAFLSALEQRASVTLPDIDGTMAALFGIGQGAYLTKKAGSDIDH
jgi:hypothetical protein